MSIRITLKAVAFVLPLAFSHLATAADSVVVYRVGDGQAPLSSLMAPVYLDEYSPTGDLIHTLQPISNAPVTASGVATVAGLLNRSTDGTQLTLTNYSVTAGQASGSSPSARQVTSVDATGAASSMPMGNASGLQPRSALQTDNGIYVASEAGVGLISGGSSTLLYNANARGLQIADGQLYYSTGTGIYALGHGLPTSSTGLSSTLIAATPSPYAFMFADLSDSIAGVDTLYVTNSTVESAAASLALRKYSLLQDGSWTLNSTFVRSGFATSLTTHGLTGSVENGTAQLYVTSAASNTSSATRLFRIVDDTGYGQSAANLTAQLLANALPNEVFRGVALAPVPEPQTWALALAGFAALAGLARRKSACSGN